MTSPGPVPTEDEREHAAIVVAHLPISIPDYTTTGLDTAAEVIAQALADQREANTAVQREMVRLVRERAWADGYDACRRGEQRHNPYRSAG